MVRVNRVTDDLKGKKMDVVSNWNEGRREGQKGK
jgi:hypothetical protein